MRPTVMKERARADLALGCDLEEKGDFEQAFDAYSRAAGLGNKEAQVNLANLYDEGRGCVKNTTKAVYWYKRAVKLGCPEAAYNLGILYQQCLKTRWADYWFKRAAEIENGI